MTYMYAYIGLLLLMIMLSVYCFSLGRKKAPGKIMIYNSIINVCIFLRYISLLILFIIQNMNYIYFTKYMVILNLAVVPCIIALCLYIFMRIDGLEFRWLFIFMALMIGFYVYVSSNFETTIEISNTFGYIIRFISGNSVQLIYICILCLGLISSVIGYGRECSNFKGMMITMVGIMAVLLEIILNLKGNTMTYNMVIGEMVLMLSLIFGLKTFK